MARLMYRGTFEKDFSIIVVNYNGGEMLIRCIQSVLSQNYPSFEVILVDNASIDGSFAPFEHCQNVIIVRNSHNQGFAGGNNTGVKYATGKYLFLLNNDAVMEPGCLSGIARAFEEIPEAGVLHPKILSMSNPELLDSCGAFWTSSTLFYSYGNLKDQSLHCYNQRMPFFALSGAALCVRHEVIIDIGLFDEDFWTFYEDIDFCHRAWVCGYECWYAPEGVVMHAGSATASSVDISKVRYLNSRNRLISLLKNFELKSLLTIIPINLSVLIIQSLTWLVQGDFSSALSAFKAIGYNITHANESLTKRRIVQSKRRNSDCDIFGEVKRNPRLSYYLILGGKKGLGEYQDCLESTDFRTCDKHTRF